MPIEKLINTSVYQDSKSLDRYGNIRICCYKCGSTGVALFRVVDKNNKKTKPAKYICTICKEKG